MKCWQMVHLTKSHRSGSWKKAYVWDRAVQMKCCLPKTDRHRRKFCCTAGRNHCAVKNGMFATLGIFILTLVFSLPLGLVITFIRMSKVKLLQWIAKIYISIMRDAPLMLQLLVVFSDHITCLAFHCHTRIVSMQLLLVLH